MSSNTFLPVLNAIESFCTKTLAKTHIQHTAYPTVVLNFAQLERINKKNSSKFILFDFIFSEPVRGKQTFFAQLHSFAKLEGFQLIILFCIFILVLNQHRKFNSFKSLSTHYPILVSIL